MRWVFSLNKAVPTDTKNSVINMHCLKHRTVSIFKYLGDFPIVCTDFVIKLFVHCIVPGLSKSPNFNWEVDDEKNSNCKTTCKLCRNYIAMLMQIVIKKVIIHANTHNIYAKISEKHPPQRNPESLVKIDVISENKF